MIILNHKDDTAVLEIWKLDYEDNPFKIWTADDINLAVLFSDNIGIVSNDWKCIK